MTTGLRYFLPAYFVLYVIIAFVWRSYVTWKRTGISPYALGKSDNAHDFVGMLFRLTIMAIFIVVILYVISSKAYAYLAPILWLDRPMLKYAGLCLLAVSFVWTLVAQAHMGNSWRIGIDPGNKTELVTHGLFGVSRNPIFLGMRITLCGFFLILPNAVTLAILSVGEALMQIQVRLEEEHLSHTHGEEYRKYRQHARRWL